MNSSAFKNGEKDAESHKLAQGTLYRASVSQCLLTEMKDLFPEEDILMSTVEDELAKEVEMATEGLDELEGKVEEVGEHGTSLCMDISNYKSN